MIREFEHLDNAHEAARALSAQHRCIYSVQHAGYRYRIQPGGGASVSHVASYFNGRPILSGAC